VDCFFHSNVPSVARCGECSRSICATCRDEAGWCPSCRLAARIDAASGERGELPGGVRRGRGAAQGGAGYGGAYGAEPNANAGTSASAYSTGSTAVATVSPETRALVALGYPFWPLAALALLDPKKSSYVRRQAVQAIGFSFGYYGLSLGLTAISQIPILGYSAWPLIPVLIPIYLIAIVVYGFKAWHGDEVRVPLLSDWLDQRWPEDAAAHG
jgi:uncharacterized membrane protein